MYVYCDYYVIVSGWCDVFCSNFCKSGFTLGEIVAVRIVVCLLNCAVIVRALLIPSERRQCCVIGTHNARSLFLW